MLEYQEKDRELVRLERELAASKERKDYVQAKKFLMAASEKLENLETRSKQLKARSKELGDKYLQAAERFGEFENVDWQELKTAEEGEVNFYKKNAYSLADELKKMKADLALLTKEIEATSKEYQELKNNVIEMQKQGKEAQKAYKDLEESKKTARETIEKELAEREKLLPSDLLAAYRTKRKEKLFPIIGKVKDNRCPFCSMELPIASLEKVAGGNYIECDCHRIIYGE